jgi:hypothetical protein
MAKIVIFSQNYFFVTILEHSKLVFRTRVVRTVLSIIRQKKISPRPPPGKLRQLRIHRKIEIIKFMIKYSLEMRNHRFFGTGISNFMFEMTTSGARAVSFFTEKTQISAGRWLVENKICSEVTFEPKNKNAGLN